MKIRTVTIADIPLVYDFICAIASFEKLRHAVVASLSDLHDSFFGPHAVVHGLLLEHEQKVIGFALYYFNFSSFVGRPGLYIEDLFVLPEYRGTGGGSLLFDAMVKIAHERSCGRMEWSVLDWNQKAIDFYITKGAVAMDGWTVYRMSEQAIAALATRADRP